MTHSLIKHYKSCSCGTGYTLTAWLKLPFVGAWRWPGGDALEMRNCTACHSTLAVELPALQAQRHSCGAHPVAAE